MTGKKLLLIVIVVIAIAGAAVGTILHSRSDVPPVTTAKAVRENLVSTVSGTGQITPKTYVNVGTTAFGRITHLYVKEGDHVKAGQLLASVEADLDQKRLDYRRARALYNDKLIAKQDFDAKKAAYDVAVATLAQRKAAVLQAKAQADSARSHVQQDIATLNGDSYLLSLTRSIAPFDALVTNVPVRQGETVVEGIQNAEGSTLMTLADMSVITAKVMVDETDIVNVAVGQPAVVSIDAYPNQTFTGKVTEVGDQALLRSTGVATSQSTTGSEQAKDFKVVVTLDPTHVDLKPGLSCEARITTARNPDALAIPIQALVMRNPAEELMLFSKHGKVSSLAPATFVRQSSLVQGVYLLVNDAGRLRVRFTPVTTGISGATDIEVLSGLKTGDEIVTGHYQILRMLRSGAAVKRDNSIIPQSSAGDSSS